MSAAAYPQASTDRKPSARQVYALAHIALEMLELEWPASRADASQLIGTLKGAAPAATPAVGADGCPF